MRRIFISVIASVIIPSGIIINLFSCTGKGEENNIAKWKTEIIETEREFSEMASKEGIQKAFLTFAAEDAVVLRNDSLIKGKESLSNYYNNRRSGQDSIILTWKPDFADVSVTGDLGYTYGKYVYKTIDSTGNVNSQEGIFHTVWKRQTDGKWRFVWD